MEWERGVQRTTRISARFQNTTRIRSLSHVSGKADGSERVENVLTGAGEAIQYTSTRSSSPITNGPPTPARVLSLPGRRPLIFPSSCFCSDASVSELVRFFDRILFAPAIFDRPFDGAIGAVGIVSKFRADVI